MNEAKTEKELAVQFQKTLMGQEPELVVESAALYDTILLSNTFYGQEADVPGWFTSFAAFAATRDHRFFKVRTEGTAGLPYTNMQSADSMPFPFYAYTMGLTFFAPSPNIVGKGKYLPPNAGAGETIPDFIDPGCPHFWTFDLPRHAAIIFKTNQDVRVECTAYACPPGYGPMGGGAAFEINTIDAQSGMAAYKQHAQMNTFGTQGVPLITNRYKFPAPIAIPKNATIEGLLDLSDYARSVVANLQGPNNYIFQNTDLTTLIDTFPARFGIQLSLFGLRLVQQRGQYYK